MGAGNWTSDSYTSYASATNYRSASRAEVFRNNSIVPMLDPRKALLRESCDSNDNPNSTPVIIGLDVTGSMGEYAELIAKEQLPEIMTAILEGKPISDPHVMFMAFTDINTSDYMNSFQVSQFEADIRVLEQLREIFLAGGGGGNSSESYDLPWYFAATRTKTDSFDKRGKKGFLFTIGDERAPYESVDSERLNRVFGGEHQGFEPKEALAMAKEKYHVFHVVIEQGGGCRSDLTRVRETWNAMLGSNVLYLSDFRCLAELITATMRIANGTSTVNDVLAQSTNRQVLAHAFQNVLGE
jgi:hypothetical protein